MNRIKKTISNITLILGSFLFALFILEIAVRIFIPVTKPTMITKKVTPADIKKPLEFLQPFFEGTFLSAEYTTEIKTNSEGFRDIEHELAKGDGIFRIVVAGDSFTFGLGVEANQTYPKILQDLLNEKSIDKNLRYEIFNMGIAGIGTQEELEILKYGLRYKPDLILLGLFVEERWNPGNGNDLYDNFKKWQRAKDEKLITKGEAGLFLRSKTKSVDYLNSFQRFLAKNSEVYFLLMTRCGTTLRKHLIRFREGQNRLELEKSWDITKDVLKKINALAKSIGVPFVIIRIPFLYDVYNQGEDKVSKILAEFAKENNINVCDPLMVLRKNKGSDLYYPADGHWKSQAHKLAADEVYNYLVNNNFLDVN